MSDENAAGFGHRMAEMLLARLNVSSVEWIDKTGAGVRTITGETVEINRFANIDGRIEIDVTVGDDGGGVIVDAGGCPLSGLRQAAAVAESRLRAKARKLIAHADALANAPLYREPTQEATATALAEIYGFLAQYAEDCEDTSVAASVAAARDSARAAVERLNDNAATQKAAP